MKELKKVKYFFVFLIFIGVSMLVWSFFMYKDSSKFLSNAIETEGSVIEVVGVIEYTRKEGSLVNYKPLIRFSDLKGNPVEFQSSIGSESATYYSIGDKVTILYNAQAPDKARVKGFSSLWGGGTIVGIFGIIFISIGVGFFLIKKKLKKIKEYLTRKSIRLETDFKDVILNTSHVVNGKNPYQVITEWQNPETSELRIFKSGHIWNDPTEYVRNKKITVLIDKNNPEKYFMDIPYLN